MTTSVYNVLHSGACNAAIARSLNESGFFVEDDLLKIVHEDDYKPDFHYRMQVTPAVIATLKRMLR